MGLLVLGLAGVETAEASAPIAIAVRGATDPQTGEHTTVQPGLVNPRVDFGHVANSGLRPRTGARIDDKGTSWYVATVELTVVRNADQSLGIRSVRAPSALSPQPDFVGSPSLGPDISAFPTGSVTPSDSGVYRSATGQAVMSPTPRRAQQHHESGIYIPAAGQQQADSTTHVDVYVRLGGQNEGAATVWFSSPQTGGVHNAVELMFAETQVASSIAIGQPFLCQISFKVAASEWGHQDANVLFSARPAGF